MRHSDIQTSMLSLTLIVAAGIAGCDDSVVGQLTPALFADPLELAFGRVPLGSTRAKSFILRNTGSAVVEIARIEEVAPFDESFRTELSRMRIAPAHEAILDVTFSPTVLGSREARLIVVPTDSRVPSVELRLVGDGADTVLGLDPERLSFGNVVVGTTKSLHIEATNDGEVAASIELVTRTGDNTRRCDRRGDGSEVFCVAVENRDVSADGRFTLEPGESTRLQVDFNPKTADSYEPGSFLLKACEISRCDTRVRLDGTGVAQGFACTPDPIDFGFVNPSACIARTLHCSNVANAPVAVLGWGLASGSIDSASGGSGTSDFRLPPSAQHTVEPGESLDIAVEFCPSSLGHDVAEMEVRTSGPRVSVELKGAGGGPDVDALPARLNFGLVTLIAPSRRTVFVQNVGVADLEVSKISATSSSFRVLGDFAGGIVAPGQSIDIVVEFLPDREGPIEGALLVESNDADEPEFRVPLAGEGIDLPSCHFEVVPDSLLFGAVELGRNLSRAFEIRNMGTFDCLVTGVRMLPGSSAAFALPDGDVVSERVPPGGSTTVRAQFSPEVEGPSAGTVEFSISNEAHPYVEVPLRGEGASATLLIVPRDLDFGVIGVGCRTRARTITVYNTGASDAELRRIALAPTSTEAFTLARIPAPLPGQPIVLAPGASTEFSVAFAATKDKSYAGAVEIDATFAGRAVTYVVSVQGRGSSDGDVRQVDEFEQLGKPKVDLLFVVDDSGSMSEEQTSLASNFDAFIRFANAQAIDYQIGVTTTDIDQGDPPENGRLVPATPGSTPAERIVTPHSSPSPEERFAMNANVGIDSGTYTEQGLQAAYLALSNPLIFGHNAGFLRPDAVLSLIFVSDEEDQSSETVDFYTNYFLSIKGFRNTNLFSASSIVGDEPAAGAPGGCSGAGGSAEPGARYAAVTRRTGGVFQSICTADWSRSLEELSATAFGFKSRFFLTNQPVIGTIRVVVDGRELPARDATGTINWTYDYGTNSVNFSPFATPEPSAQIRMEYVAECL